MSNMINLTSRLNSLSQALIAAEREEDEANVALRSAEEHSLEGLPEFEARYEEACRKVDDISNEIDEIEKELEELTNQHDRYGEEY